MLTAEDTDTDVLASLEDEFPCADSRHPSGQSYHNPAQPAEFVLINPCCGDRALVCRSRAYYLKYQAAEIHCGRCHEVWPPDRYRFVPISPKVAPL